MKYGEIQAIVQLSVGLNFGIFALTQISLPYKKKQERHLKNIYKYKDSIEFMINNTKEPEKRSILGVRFKEIEDKLMKHVELTNGNWRSFRYFVYAMIFAAILGIILGMLMLYDTARYYDAQIPFDMQLLVGSLYIPLVIGFLMNFYARAMGYFKIRNQNAIREELGEII